MKFFLTPRLKCFYIVLLIVGFISGCRLTATEPNPLPSQYLNTVLIKADLTDIRTISPAVTVFLRDEKTKFPSSLPKSIEGLEYTKIMKGANSVKQVFNNGKNPFFIALNTAVFESKDWINLGESFEVDSKSFYLYKYALHKKASWVTIPQIEDFGTLLFAKQLELVNTDPPGTVIAESYDAKLHFITDPTIVVLPNGKYLAGCKSRFDGKKSTFRVFESNDKGRSWNKIADINEVGFCNLFYHRGALYIMGTKGGFNHAVIIKSLDEGKTWTTPTDHKNGLLMGRSKSFHSAPVPVVVNNGRIWRAMEDNIPLGERNFRAFVMSAPENANLLDSTSWICSTPLPYKEEWLSGGRTFNGWLEGNAVIAPDGSIVDMIRIEERTFDGKIGMIHISADGKISTFDPKKDIVDFPGGSKKFDIRFDSISKKYWSITNHTFDQDRGKVHCGLTRNHVVLTSSKDLLNWVIKDTLISNNDPYHHGYQYISWQFDGNDIVAVSRTAHDYKKGLPVRQHDANYFTFHRFKSFRN